MRTKVKPPELKLVGGNYRGGKREPITHIRLDKTNEGLCGRQPSPRGDLPKFAIDETKTDCYECVRIERTLIRWRWKHKVAK